MLEDEFEGYNPDEIENIGLGPEEETENLFVDQSRPIESIDSEGKYWVRIYHHVSTKEKPVERDVTELLKNRSDISLVDLIKYVSENQRDGVEKSIAEETLGYIKRFEDRGDSAYINREYFLAIKSLDREKRAKTFYKDFVKGADDNSSSGIYALPTTHAIGLFETRPEDSMYRLDLKIDVKEMGGN